MAAASVTAALLVIGDEILSGRTKDKNIGYIAEYLTAVGIDLREVRVVPDIEDEIVAAVNALRARHTYLFTTGGIGPTHDDITADCVAKAIGVAIDVDPRAVAMMRERYKPEDLNEARLRMARIPTAPTSSITRSRGRPFRIANVIVMAGVPTIMQAMLDNVAPTLATGARMIVETVARGRRAGGALCGGARRHRQGASARLDRLLSGLLGERLRQPDRRARQGPRRRRRRLGRGARPRCRLQPAPPPPDRCPNKVAMTSPSQKAFPVSWDQFHRDARALAWRVSAEGPFEAIVCITRGGLVPAAISVARELGTRLIETVCVADYLDYKNQSDLMVLKGVSPAVKALGDGRGRGVLVVDDLTDTGKTANSVESIKSVGRER